VVVAVAVAVVAARVAVAAAVVVVAEFWMTSLPYSAAETSILAAGTAAVAAVAQGPAGKNTRLGIDIYTIWLE